MHINPNIEKPIFIQIAEQLEDSIFTKVFPEETKIPSTNELSSLLNINPHTVLKGMNLLVDEEIIYKKRGLGMFVKKGAVNKILLKRTIRCCIDSRGIQTAYEKRRNYFINRKGF